MSALMALCILAAGADAQVSDKIGKITTGTAEPGKILSFQVELLQASTLDRIELAYRQFGVREFSRIEMSLTGNIASATLPAEAVVPPFVEYYLLLYYAGKEVPETYPVENPEQSPLQINVQPGTAEKTQIIILSPDPGERVQVENLLISLSLAQFDSSSANGPIRVSVDNTDLSAGIVRYGDLIVVRPENISATFPAGAHEVHVALYDSSGNSIDSVSWSFSLEGIVTELPQITKPVSPIRTYSSLLLETRQENIAGSTTPFYRSTLNANASYNEYQVRGSLYLTNEEKQYRQPQNRFLIVAEAPWLKIGYGDSYPTLPELIMNGKRLRGFFGYLTQNKFSLDVAFGTVTRKINGSIGVPFPDSSLATEQANDPTASFQIYDTTGGIRQWVKMYPGTYERDLFVVHPIFGKRLGSHWGFTYLKGKDDIGSLKYGIRPQENAVFGTDLLLSVDRQNFEIMAEAAISATNKDISEGSYTDEDIDSLFSDEDERERRDIRHLRDFFSNIITINENIVPLGIKNVPTLSYESGIALNYFHNTFRFTYLRHGEAYESFGQTYLRNDIQGFTITDRLRLLKNQIFLSTGYERLRDNTSGSKPATTATNTANISVSYFPAINFPNITLSYLNASNDNDLNLSDSLYAISDRTNRVLLHVSKEIMYLARNNLYLSVGTSVRNDATIRDLDTRSTTVGIGAVSKFDIPLQTTFNITVNANKIVTSSAQSSSITYTTLYASAQYLMLKNKMTLMGALSPTFGDIQRYLVNLGVQYVFLPYLTARTDLSLYFNQKLYNLSNVKNDVIWTFTIRADV
jgi:hypothetical protein